MLGDSGVMMLAKTLQMFDVVELDLTGLVVCEIGVEDCTPYLQGTMLARKACEHWRRSTTAALVGFELSP